MPLTPPTSFTNNGTDFTWDDMGADSYTLYRSVNGGAFAILTAGIVTTHTTDGSAANGIFAYKLTQTVGADESGFTPTLNLTAQAAFGQTDALARAVAAWLNTNSGTFALPVSAERRFRLVSDLPEIPIFGTPASVDVFPGAEEGERQGISGAFASQYMVHLYIQQRTDPAQDEETQCSLVTLLRSQIIEALKRLMFDLDSATHPVKRVFLSHLKNGDKGLYNLSRLIESHVYESDTILVFKAAA